MLTDTHCHLDYEWFDVDREDVIRRALDAGLGRLLIPALDLESAHAALELAERYEPVYAAVGLHPNSATAWTEAYPEHLRELAGHPKILAIGEIGLDYYRDRAPQDLQHRVLRAQLDLAAELELPVVIHNREAGEDVIAELSGWQRELEDAGSPLAARPGVLHSFLDSRDVALSALEAGFFIGITGPVTFKNAPGLQALVAELPLERLLIETDAPFLAPHPHRGKRNEPARVRLVAEKIAELKDLPVDKVVEATWENSVTLFAW